MIETILTILVVIGILTVIGLIFGLMLPVAFALGAKVRIPGAKYVSKWIDHWIEKRFEWEKE